MPRLTYFVRRKPFRCGKALSGCTDALKRHIHFNGSFPCTQVSAIYALVSGIVAQICKMPASLRIFFRIQQQNSAAARGFFAARNFCERTCVGGYCFRDGMAVDELPFAAAVDQSGFAQNFQVV